MTTLQKVYKPALSRSTKKSILYTETTEGELSLSTTEHKGKDDGGGGGFGMLYPHTSTVKCSVATRGTAQNPSWWVELDLMHGGVKFYSGCIQTKLVEDGGIVPFFSKKK